MGAMEPDSLVGGTSLDMPDQVAFFGALAHEIEELKKELRKEVEDIWIMFRDLVGMKVVRYPLISRRIFILMMATQIEFW